MPVVPNYCLFFNLYQKAWEYEDWHVCVSVFLHVWVLPAPFTEWICVTSCLTVLSWLLFLSLQRSGLDLVPWLMLETKGSLPQRCPCDNSQHSGSLYGSWDVRSCLCTGCSCYSAFARDLCCWVTLCMLSARLSSRQQAVSALNLSSSHSWSTEMPMWSDSSPSFHPLT